MDGCALCLYHTCYSLQSHPAYHRSSLVGALGMYARCGLRVGAGAPAPPTNRMCRYVDEVW